ncbi:MAG: hypothetical protein CK551_00410 [Planctomycetaceae bacterium]|nr:MAG: hypothetical protein CK551_00410 [Planctomycetaceae bacterium]
MRVMLAKVGFYIRVKIFDSDITHGETLMLNRQNAITQTLHGFSHANNNAGQSLMKSITQQESKIK